MTTSIHGQPDFLGVPLARVRNLLKAWRGTDLEAAASSTDVDIPLPDALALASELAAQGFIHPEGWIGADDDDRFLTTKGLALALAVSRKRTPLAKAQEIVDAVLRRAERNNADPARLHDIDEIWLFGSTAAGSATVGDVDVAVEARPTERLLRIVEDARRHGLVDPALPKSLLRNSGSGDIHRHLLDRTLHGARRNPLLSVHDIELLKALHRPCRLLMTELGAIHDQPLLPHHPASTGRGQGFMERRTLEAPVTPEMPTGLSMRGLERYAWRWSPVYMTCEIPDGEMRAHALFRAGSLPKEGGIVSSGQLHELDPNLDDYVVARLDPSKGLTYDPVGTIGFECRFEEGEVDMVFTTMHLTEWTRGEVVSCGRHVALAAAAAVRYGVMCRPGIQWTLAVRGSDPGAVACIEEAMAIADRLPGWLAFGPDCGDRQVDAGAVPTVSWEAGDMLPAPW
jgi:hypothetical protein